MQIIVVFGFPGAGKSFVAKILQHDFGYYHYDGDLSMPESFLKAINSQTIITEKMRDDFFQKLISDVKKLKLEHKKIVVSQTFIKEKYRSLFLSAFPKAKFILVKTITGIREKRLIQRQDFPLDLEYSRKMCLNFDEPEIIYDVVNNDSDGKEDVKKQLQFFSI
jgi:gluconate kinase